MAIVTFALVGLGIALIVTGAAMSVADWERRHRPKPQREVVTDQTALPETLEGLAKLADALREHKPGMQLIIVGIAVLIIAGIFGGIAQL